MSFTWFTLICFAVGVLRQFFSGGTGAKKLLLCDNGAQLPQSWRVYALGVVRIIQEISARLPSEALLNYIKHSSIVSWERQLKRLPNVDY